MKTTSKVQARAKEMFGFITEARHGGYFRETIGNHLAGSRNVPFDPPIVSLKYPPMTCLDQNARKVGNHD